MTALARSESLEGVALVAFVGLSAAKGAGMTFKA
jgi:hypothetical protein